MELPLVKNSFLNAVPLLAGICEVTNKIISALQWQILLLYRQNEAFRIPVSWAVLHIWQSGQCFCLVKLPRFFRIRRKASTNWEIFPSLQNEPPRVEQREWRLRPFNYDNTINAMLTLFVVTTGEGWPGIRQNSMDTTFEDQGPSPFYRVEVRVLSTYTPYLLPAISLFHRQICIGSNSM